MPPAPAGKQAAQLRAHLLELLGPLVTAEGFDLEDVTVTAAGRRSLIRVIVDGDDGVDLDAVANISRAASEALDTVDGTGGSSAFADPYVLEVSSPGVDRPLTEPPHWRRATGRLVQTQQSGKAVTGRILAVTETGVLLDIVGGGRKPVPTEVVWAELGPGKVQIEFNRKGAEPGVDGSDTEDTEATEGTYNEGEED
jgi:ribosome maturation factor RimP